MRINPNAAGIDVDAKEHVVAVPCDQEPQPVRTFQAFTLELHELARWLKRCGIETVALQSTGIYCHLAAFHCGHFVAAFSAEESGIVVICHDLVFQTFTKN